MASFRNYFSDLSLPSDPLLQTHPPSLPIPQLPSFRSTPSPQLPCLCLHFQSPPHQKLQKTQLFSHPSPSLSSQLWRLLSLPQLWDTPTNLFLHYGHRKQPCLVPLHQTLHLLQMPIPKHQPSKNFNFQAQTLLLIQNRRLPKPQMWLDFWPRSQIQMPKLQQPESPKLLASLPNLHNPVRFRHHSWDFTFRDTQFSQENCPGFSRRLLFPLDPPTLWDCWVWPRTTIAACPNGPLQILLLLSLSQIRRHPTKQRPCPLQQQQWQQLKL